MTEASDRIYNEVGEDADIIWGTVVDDSLGDEMRVTLIATGIGTEPVEAEPRDELPRRGVVRDLTASDLQSAEDLEVPTFIRHKEAVGESDRATYRGYKGIVLDNSDLDVPTFLRRKAD